MKAAAIVTKDGLKQMLNAADAYKRQHIIGRALCVLFDRQTASEQNANTTDEDNGVGFTGADARGGSLTAKSYRKNKGLVQWQMEQWMRLDGKGYPRLCKYHKQLNTAAVLKAARATLVPVAVPIVTPATAPVGRVQNAYQAAKDGESFDNAEWIRMKNEFAQREAQQEQAAFEFKMRHG